MAGSLKLHAGRTILVLIAAGGAMLTGGCPRLGPPSGSGQSVSIELVASGFVAPVALAPAPDGSGRLFVVDQVGRIHVIDPDGTLRATPFLDIHEKLVNLSPSYDERGLLGLAFHPDYRNNGRFFVYYSAPLSIDAPPDFDSQVTLSEFSVSADANLADAASERIILRIAHPQANHYGGQLAFGPDGFLYIGIGDGGAANDVGNGHNPGIGNGQDLSTLLGKILRIDVNDGNPYSIPSDNPFLTKGNNTRPEIFAFGLRNPWKFSFAADGRLFVGDVGQNIEEEVDIVTRGGNYGWRIKEGTLCFDKDQSDSPGLACANVDADGNPLVDPIIEYAHSDSNGAQTTTAVIGGFQYAGSAVTALKDRYVFGDFSSNFFVGDGSLFAAKEASDGTWSFEELTVSNGKNGRLGEFLKALGQDANGELYVLTSEVAGPSGATGKVRRIIK